MKPRRWFRFSLRTLFVLLTLFGVWLGVQVKWIRDRDQALIWVLQNHGFFFNPESLPAMAPWSLRLLGEAGVGEINFRMVHQPESELEEREKVLKTLFPEAFIRGTT